MAGCPKPFWPSAILGEWMEHLWSPAGATGGNRWQMAHPRKQLKQADRQPVATHGNRFAAHGKEGVSGSSPEEGSHRSPANAGLLLSRCNALSPACSGMEQILEQP